MSGWSRPDQTRPDQIVVVPYHTRRPRLSTDQRRGKKKTTIVRRCNAFGRAGRGTPVMSCCCRPPLLRAGTTTPPIVETDWEGEKARSRQCSAAILQTSPLPTTNTALSRFFSSSCGVKFDAGRCRHRRRCGRACLLPRQKVLTLYHRATSQR